MGIPDLLKWLESAPSGTTVRADALAELLEGEVGAEQSADTPQLPPVELTWRERLWLVPAETRLGTRDVLDALGRSRSWLYSHLGADQGIHRIPHRKLDAELVFAAGELRAWIRAHEEIVAAGPMEPAALEGLRIVEGGAA